MAIQLFRRPIQVNVHDVDGVRKWLMDRVREEVMLKGAPHPRIIGLLPGFEEIFDLDAMARRHPEAHPGATFQALRARTETARRFVLIQLQGEDDVTHATRTWACLIEECDRFDGRKWWMGMLEYKTDPNSGIGVVEQPWGIWPGETDDLTHVEFIREFVEGPPGARPAEFLPPPDVWQPDVKFTFGELHPSLPTPTGAKQVVEVAAKMGMNDLLTGKLQGSLILRLNGRSWEVFVVSGQLPDPIEELVRWVANRRLPPAEAVALLAVAIRPGQVPPEPGVQIVAEMDGKVAECWAPIEFPEGPQGPKVVTKIWWSHEQPVREGGMWLGVEPNVTFDELGPEA